MTTAAVDTNGWSWIKQIQAAPAAGADRVRSTEKDSLTHRDPGGQLGPGERSVRVGNVVHAFIVVSVFRGLDVVRLWRVNS